MHQNSQTISSIDKALASKSARCLTAIGRSMFAGRANRRTPIVARAITEGCSSGHSADYYSEDQYAVSIKEDTVPALIKDHKGKKINTPYLEEVNTPY
ncbi:hypothetical protein Tco_0001261 [Tanacetum coccineum]